MRGKEGVFVMVGGGDGGEGCDLSMRGGLGRPGRPGGGHQAGQGWTDGQTGGRSSPINTSTSSRPSPPDSSPSRH